VPALEVREPQAAAEAEEEEDLVEEIIMVTAEEEIETLVDIGDEEEAEAGEEGAEEGAEIQPLERNFTSETYTMMFGKKICGKFLINTGQ